MKTISLSNAVELIPDGASLMIGGFMAVGSPERVIDELVRQRKRNLTIIAPELLKFLQWEKPVRVPKPYDDWPDKPYYIPHMQMSRELYQKIDWEAKLDEGSRRSTC